MGVSVRPSGRPQHSRPRLLPGSRGRRRVRLSWHPGKAVGRL